MLEYQMEEIAKTKTKQESFCLVFRLHPAGELGSRRKKRVHSETSFVSLTRKHKTLEAAGSQTQDNRSSRLTTIRHSKQQARVS